MKFAKTKFVNYQKYEKDIEGYRKNIESYRRNIEKLIGEFTPKINIPLAVVGFFLAVSGIVPVLIMAINAAATSQALTAPSIVACFFCYVTSFFGYMLIHRSTERDWL